jgi:hypothetical protein
VQSLKLSELMGALSHALDITEGQPEGHCVRCCSKTWAAPAMPHTMNVWVVPAEPTVTPFDVGQFMRFWQA